jgi:hypothetical protein
MAASSIKQLGGCSTVTRWREITLQWGRLSGVALQQYYHNRRDNWRSQGQTSQMSLFRRLLPAALLNLQAPFGFADLLSLGRRKPTPQLGKPLPHGKTRVHFLAGYFETKDSARHYCFHSERNVPEDLTRELPDAFIDIAHVEVVFEGHRERLSEFLDPAQVDLYVRKLYGKNTLILIAEPAFGGFPYALNDTSVLTYLGAEVVDV